MMLSVIIPVYNVEIYLERCFKSLEKQNNEMLEILLIDDGSTDNSGYLCDEFAMRHSNIIVIHKENGGLSDARNEGINAAHGDYIMFLDSDDELIPYSCEMMLKKVCESNLDVLYGGINWIKGVNKVFYTKEGIGEDEVLSGKIALLNELKTGKFAAMAQLGIYKIDFLKNNNLYFKNGILHEDEQWMPRVMVSAERVMKVNISFYNYYIRENSISQSKNIKRYYDLIDTINELEHLYDNIEYKDLSKYGKQYLAKMYMSTVAYLYSMGEKIKIKESYLEGNIMGYRNYIKYIIFKYFPRLYVKLLLNSDR